MTQVLQHDYGKSKVTLVQIRAAIKAVKADRSESGRGQSKRKAVTTKKPSKALAAESRKRA